MASEGFFAQYRHPKWQAFAAEVRERAGHRCEGCGADDKLLQAHHGYYGKDMKPWDYQLPSMHALCADCHESAAVLGLYIREQIACLDIKTLPDVLRILLCLRGHNKIQSGDIRPSKTANEFFAVAASGLINKLPAKSVAHVNLVCDQFFPEQEGAA